MSWYEATSDRSFALCRSLLSNDKNTLDQFDKILKKHGLEYLVHTQPVQPLLTSRQEAVRELKWLRTFMQSVEDRTKRLGVNIKKRRPEDMRQNANNAVSVPAQETTLTAADHAVEYAAETAKVMSRTAQVATDRARRAAMTAAATAASSARRKMIAMGLPVPPSRRERREQEKKARRTALYKSRQPRSGRQAEPQPQTVQTTANDTTTTATTSATTSNTNGSIAKGSTQDGGDTWCICRGPSNGLMIACDNENCETEWFHAKCVGLSQVPSTWLCTQCRPQVNNNSREAEKQQKLELNREKARIRSRMVRLREREQRELSQKRARERQESRKSQEPRKSEFHNEPTKQDKESEIMRKRDMALRMAQEKNRMVREKKLANQERARARAEQKRSESNGTIVNVKTAHGNAHNEFMTEQARLKQEKNRRAITRSQRARARSGPAEKIKVALTATGRRRRI